MTILLAALLCNYGPYSNAAPCCDRLNGLAENHGVAILEGF
jgi:hypothetical protein